MWKSSVILCATLALTAALDAPATYILHEERHSIPSRWTKRDRVAGDAILPVRIGLTQNNLENAHEFLMDVSDPKSSNYGKHWTSAEVIEKFKPADETVDAVRSWLVDSGIDNDMITHTENKAWFAFSATIEQMESLLHTEYFEFEDLVTGGIMPACDRYYVPETIQKHIDYITPGIKLLAPAEGPKEHHKRGASEPTLGHAHRHRFSRPKRELSQKSSTALGKCDELITPACIAALYEIPPAHLASPGNSMGIFEAELQFWDQHDLNNFFANFTPWIPNGTHPINKLVDGGVAKVGNSISPNYTYAGEEALLDLDVAYPIVYPQTITIWDVDDLHYQRWNNDTYTWGFNTLLDAIDGSYCKSCAYGECGDARGIDPKYPDVGPKNGYQGQLQCGTFKPTNVFSLSYSGQEADVAVAYQRRQCIEFLKLGLQGISFFFASSDTGVGNWEPPYGSGCLGPENRIFNPTWPNTCPYVTSVGATKLYPGSTVHNYESAAYDPATRSFPLNYSSTGGFSNVYSIPSYQKSAVRTFFDEHDPPYPYYEVIVPNRPNPKKPHIAAHVAPNGGIYNRIGRGFPDVAANGDNGAVFYDGVFLGGGGGTSMSAPIFAAVVNRINEERIASGKSTVGFVNPALYSHPEMLNDITNGTNPGCGTMGFQAAKGWDPVTGLGTPNYPKMLEYFMSLP